VSYGAVEWASRTSSCFGLKLRAMSVDVNFNNVIERAALLGPGR